MVGNRGTTVLATGLVSPQSIPHNPRPNSDCGRNYSDAVLTGEIGALCNVDLDKMSAFRHQTPLEGMTLGTQWMDEQDDDVAGFLDTQVGEIYSIKPMAADATDVGGESVPRWATSEMIALTVARISSVTAWDLFLGSFR